MGDKEKEQYIMRREGKDRENGTEKLGRKAKIEE